MADDGVKPPPPLVRSLTTPAAPARPAKHGGGAAGDTVVTPRVPSNSPSRVVAELSHGAGCVQVRMGDLTREEVDVVVNAANGHLMHGGGVAAALVRAGGSVITRESRAWVAEHGSVPTGAAAWTHAGMLPAAFVVHTVGPVWRGGRGQEREELASAVRAALQTAEARGARSIAMCAVSSGIFGFPKKKCARIMMTEVMTWLEQAPPPTLTRIHLTNFDAPTVDVFQAECEKRNAHMVKDGVDEGEASQE